MNSKSTIKKNNTIKKNSKKDLKKDIKKDIKKSSKKDSKKNSKKDLKKSKSKKGKNVLKKSKLRREKDHKDSDSEEDSPKMLSDDIGETLDFNKYMESLDNKISDGLKEENKEKQVNNYQNELVDVDHFKKKEKEKDDEIYIEDFDKNSQNINILEQYINNLGKIVVLITGMPCTDKSLISKLLYEDLNSDLRSKFVGDKRINLINMKDYFLEHNYETIEVEKGDKKIKLKVYETSENYDWETLNNDMLKENGGSIIFGNFINIEKIKFRIDFTFFIDMSVSQCKKIILNKKILPFEKEKEEMKINTYFEKVLIPVYEEMKDGMKINKFFKLKGEDKKEVEDLYSNVYETLVSMIQNVLE